MKRKLQIVLIFTLSLVWLILPKAVVRAATYYLDASATGAGTGTSWEDAWTTLAQAQASVQGGDTVILRSGNYGQFREDGPDSRTNWITYKAEAGATVIFTDIRSYNANPRDKYLHFEGITLTGYDDDINKRAVLLTLASYVTFIKCDFVGRAYEHGDVSDAIYAYHGNNITVEDCYFEDFDYGISFRNVDDVNILNNRFYNLRYGIQAWGNNWRISENDLQRTSDGIRVHCANSIIENNSIHNTSSPDPTDHVDAIQIFRAGAMNPTPDAPIVENIIFRNNHIYDNQRGQGIFGGMGNQEARNITFENNLIEDCAIHHFTVYNFKDVIFRNNTIPDGTALFTTSYVPDIHGPDPEGRGPTTIASMSGNILYRCTIDNTTTVNYEDYNILWYWWGTWSGGPMEGYVPGAHSIEYGNQSIWEAQFADYNAKDFHLASDSDAIDFCPLNNAPATDLEGNARVDIPEIIHHNDPNCIADAGCYEYGTAQEDENDSDYADKPDKTKLECYNNVIKPLKGEEALIWVELQKQARVKVNLYNTKGNRIRELVDKEEDAGTWRYYWNGKDDSGNVVGSGLYFVHIQAGDYKKTKKIVVVK